MYNTWDLTDDARKKLSVLWNGFARMIEPKTNYRLNRFNLQRYRQAEHESVDEYMTRCKLQAKKCNLRDAIETDERLIEQLTVGIKHARIQEKLLSHDATLTLDGAIDMARTFEATMTDMKQFNGWTTINQINLLEAAASIMQILRRKPSTWKRSLSCLRKSMREMWSTEPLENRMLR